VGAAIIQGPITKHTQFKGTVIASFQGQGSLYTQRCTIAGIHSLNTIGERLEIMGPGDAHLLNDEEGRWLNDCCGTAHYSLPPVPAPPPINEPMEPSTNFHSPTLPTDSCVLFESLAVAPNMTAYLNAAYKAEHALLEQ
jgi:hypothetical protein